MAEGGPTLCDSRQVYQPNVFRKLDLVLYKDDGLEYDEHGCFQCIPACQKPVYKSGELLTGYLMVRPAKDITITGFSVTFGGRYETSWTEHTFHWSSSRVFFSETSQVIQKRLIALDRKWYRFDFEYQLPRGLPCSLKEPEGRVTYYAYGSVSRPDGADIDTYDTHFSVTTPMDVDIMPAIYHEPCHRKRKKTLAADKDISSEHDSGDVTEYCSTGEARDPHVIATLCLSNRAFITGHHMVVDVTIENNSLAHLMCTLRFEQVLIFEAHTGREYCGKDRPPLYLSQTRTKATRKNVCRPSNVKTNPGAAEAFNCIFHVPDVVPSTPERYSISKDKILRQRDPLIKVKYYITLVLSASWMDDEMMMPVEVKIGNFDSSTRSTASSSGERSLTSSRVMPRWTDTPNSEEAPPGYEEHYDTSV